MEIAYLPKHSPIEKKYKHFTVNAIPENSITVEAKMEFFYVGERTSAINTLVNLFESGYATDDVKKAFSILSKLIETKHTVPVVIIMDGSLGKQAFQSMHLYMAARESLQSIPLVADVSLVNGELTSEIRSVNIIDEIIDLNNISDRFLTQIKRIRRIKDSRSQKDFHLKLEQSISVPKHGTEALRRTFDVLISSLALILCLPIICLIAIAIKIESKGPLFYISKRAGRGYKIFDFYKFRTMEMDADKKIEELSHLNLYKQFPEEGGMFFKVDNDPRITRVGAFLRNTSLDELPQLINVFLGHMSLVGNRPLPLYEAATLTTDGYAERFMAPAGITGLWQIKKRGQKDMSAEERINLDIAYAQRNNFMFDLWIMANTPTALIQKTKV